MSWTPGPWEVGPSDRDVYAAGEVVAYVNAADACLIAAAPEMAELLAELAPDAEPWDIDQDCRFCGGHFGEHEDDCEWRRARALLARIRGEA